MKNTFKVSELSTLLKRGITPSYTDAPKVLVINQKCIRDYKLNLDLARYTDPEKKKIADEKYLKSYDVLVNSTGVGTLGRVAQISEVNGPVTSDSHVTILRPDNQIIDPLYFGYCLKSKQKNIELLGAGSTGQTELSRVVLGDMEIEILEDFKEQKVVGYFLKTIDNKIELNQKMNETLEEIAKTLFKSWFIDFDPVRAKAEGRPTGFSKEISDFFPDSFEDSELGKIPKGWQVLKIDDCCDTTDYVANGSFKTLKDNINRVDGKERDDAILIRVTDHNSNWNSEFQYIDDDSYEFLKKTKLFPEDLIICNVGDVGKCFLLPDLGRKMSLGPNAILCKNFEKKELISKEYLFYFLNNSNTQNILKSIATGSVQSKFNKTQFRSLKLVTPGEGLLNSFTGTIKEIFKKKNLIFNENNILSELRDTLLPKLISGELKIP